MAIIRSVSAATTTLNTITWLVLLIINILVLISTIEFEPFSASDIILVFVPVVGLILSLTMSYFFSKKVSIHGIIWPTLSLCLGSFLLLVVMASGAG